MKAKGERIDDVSTYCNHFTVIEMFFYKRVFVNIEVVYR